MKLFIVTGISSGLGEKISEKLIDKKEKMIGIGRRFTDVQELYALQNSNLLHLIKYDFGDSLGISKLEEQLKDILTAAYTKIIFINNAGVVEPIGKIGDLNDLDSINYHVNINYLTPLLMTNKLVELKRETTVLEIINISSGAAESPIPGWSLYCSTKKAMKIFLDILGKERQNDIVIKHIDPGVMDTNMQKSIRSTSVESFPLVEQFIGYEESGLLLTPDVVAARILKGYI